jgi:hypothetical protein
MNKVLSLLILALLSLSRIVSLIAQSADATSTGYRTHLHEPRSIDAVVNKPQSSVDLLKNAPFQE